MLVVYLVRIYVILQCIIISSLNYFTRCQPLEVIVSCVNKLKKIVGSKRSWIICIYHVTKPISWHLHQSHLHLGYCKKWSTRKKYIIFAYVIAGVLQSQSKELEGYSYCHIGHHDRSGINSNICSTTYSSRHRTKDQSRQAQTFWSVKPWGATIKI